MLQVLNFQETKIETLLSFLKERFGEIKFYHICITKIIFTINNLASNPPPRWVFYCVVLIQFSYIVATRPQPNKNSLQEVSCKLLFCLVAGARNPLVLLFSAIGLTEQKLAT